MAETTNSALARACPECGARSWYPCVAGCQQGASSRPAEARGEAACLLERIGELATDGGEPPERLARIAALLATRSAPVAGDARDGARLDWLETAAAHEVKIVTHELTDGSQAVCLTRWHRRYITSHDWSGYSLREAIDAAMSTPTDPAGGANG